MPTPERATTGLTGLAFLARAMVTGGPLYARIGYALAGWHLVSSAFSGARADSPIGVGRSSLGESSTARTKLKFESRKARTISERVNFIHEQALKGVHDPKVYALARKVLARKCGDTWCIPEKDALGEVTAMFAQVKQNVRYTWDPINYDAFQTPQKTLELHTGDCDDADSLLAALLMSIGYKVASRVVHTKGNPTWNHIYLRVQLPDGKWMPLDPTVDRPAGWEVPRSMMVRDPMDFAIPAK